MLRRASTTQDLTRLVSTYGAQFNYLHIACCLNRLAKASDAVQSAEDGGGGGSPQEGGGGGVDTVEPGQQARCLLERLEAQLVQQVESFTPRELCNVMWAWAKLGHVPAPETWLAVRARLFGSDDGGAGVSDAGGMGVSRGDSHAQCRWSEAESEAQRSRWGGGSGVPGAGSPGVGDPGEAASPQAPAGGEDFVGGRGIAVGAGVRDGDVVLAPSPALAARTPKPHLGPTSYSGQSNEQANAGEGREPARLPPPSPDAVALSPLAGATPQGLSNVAWSLTRLGCTDRFAWLRLAEASLRALPSYRPYDIANTAYAFAAARQHRSHPTHIALMHGLAAAALEQLEYFCPQDLSNTLWAFARVGMPQPQLFAAASAAVRRTMPGFTHGGMVQVLWAYATLRVRDAPLLGDIARAMLPQLAALAPRNLALLCWALARLVVGGFAVAAPGAAPAAADDGESDGGDRGAASGGEEFVHTNFMAAGSLVGSSPITLALAARVRAGVKNPLSKYYEEGGKAAAAAAAAAEEDEGIAGGGGQGRSGKSRSKRDRRGGGAGDGGGAPASIAGRTPTRSADGIQAVSAAGAAATMPAFAFSARAAAAQQAELDLDLELSPDTEAEAQAIVVAGGRGQHGGAAGAGPAAWPRGVAAAAAASVAQPQVAAEAAASTAAAEALAHVPPQLLSAVATSARCRLSTLDTRHLSILLWAMASLGHADPPLFAAAAAELAARLRLPCRVTPPCISHIAWSYAVSRQYDAELYGALAEAAGRMCDAFHPPAVSLALANVLWALGRAGHYDPAVFAVASRTVVAAATAAPFPQAGPAANPAVNQLALVMLACSFVGHEDPELYASVGGALRGAGPAAVRDASLANICWSMAVLDLRDLPLLAELFRAAAARGAEAIGARGCTQLFQCCLWLRDLVPGGENVAALLPPAIQQVGRAAFQQLAKDASISDFQSEVFIALESLGLQPRMETKTPDQLFSLDTVVSLGGRQLAVESNGPQHYLRTHPEVFSGTTRLRSALLRARGFEPLHISWQQWDGLGGDRIRQRLFLRARLREAASRLRLSLPPGLLQDGKGEEEEEARLAVAGSRD